MIVCGTGHRPEDCEDELGVRAKVRIRLSDPTKQIDVFISGMAAGYDLWAADEARLLEIPVWAARPWRGHKPRKEDEELYQTILDYAEKEIIVVESDEFPGNWAYHARNKWMVDNADAVLMYWNGKESGGTYACRNYAKGKKPITNIYYDPPF